MKHKFLVGFLSLLLILVLVGGICIFTIPSIQSKIADGLIEKSSIYQKQVDETKQKDLVINNLNAEIIDNQKLIIKYKNQIETIKENANLTILEKDNEISNLQNEIAELNKKIKQLEQNLSEISNAKNLNYKVNSCTFFAGINNGNDFVFYAFEQYQTDGSFVPMKNQYYSIDDIKKLNGASLEHVHCDYSITVNCLNIGNINTTGSTYHSIKEGATTKINVIDENNNPINFDKLTAKGYYVSLKSPFIVVNEVDNDYWQGTEITDLTIDLIVSENEI